MSLVDMITEEPYPEYVRESEPRDLLTLSVSFAQGGA